LKERIKDSDKEFLKIDMSLTSHIKALYYGHTEAASIRHQGNKMSNNLKLIMEPHCFYDNKNIRKPLFKLHSDAALEQVRISKKNKQFEVDNNNDNKDIVKLLEKMKYFTRRVYGIQAKKTENSNKNYN